VSFLSEYGLFLAKTATIVVAVAAVLAIAAVVLGRAARRGERGLRRPGARGLEVKNLNRRYEDLGNALRQGMLTPRAAKQEAKRLAKERKAQDKARSKALDAAASDGTARESTLGEAATGSARPRVFVLNFTGDIRATQVSGLREEITAIVSLAADGDEVLVRLSNPGGTVNDQGFAAAQLQRVRSRGIRLTVAVDTMAASGGYMMACVADRILAAPFAVVGSIGVVAQIPNAYRLLDRAGIDYEQFTGGAYKRTVTPFTRTTDEARAKLASQIDETHTLFKEFVVAQRPQLDIEQVATGEYWYGTRALELGLVDELVTSDDYLLRRRDEADLFEVTWSDGRGAGRRLASLLQSVVQSVARSVTADRPATDQLLARVDR
jgi:serine protease SohB